MKILRRITSDHVKLKSYSVMRVNLATQVLSSTMSSVLTQFGPPEASATAEYCKMIGQFFDCLNVRSFDEHLRKRKPLLALSLVLKITAFSFLKMNFWDTSETGKKALKIVKENLLPMLVQRCLCHGTHMKGYKLQCIPS